MTTVSGNDGMRQKVKQILQNLPYRETFRVGARVTYSCRPGYKVRGTWAAFFHTSALGRLVIA